MTHRRLTALLAVAAGLSATGAFAQSYNAPAGIPAAVAPAGLEGRAALPNLQDYHGRQGRAVVPRGYEHELTTGSVRARRSDRW